MTANDESTDKQLMEELENEFKKIDILESIKAPKLKEMATQSNITKTTTAKVIKKRLLTENVMELTLYVNGLTIGQSIGVLPANSSKITNALSKLLNLDQQIFTNLDLSLPKKPFIRLMAEKASGSDQKRLLYLSSLTGKPLYDKLKHLNILDLFQLFPSCRVSSEMITSLPLLKPRFYSISKATETTITIAFDIIGLCTNYLASLPLDTVLEIQPGKVNFQIPETKDLLMIATGTGISPFIGIIQESLKKRVKCKLIIGFRHELLYKDEIGEFEKDGLEVIRVSSSIQKKYVQEFVSQVDLGFERIYVCGSLKMGRGVDEVLVREKVEMHGFTSLEAVEYWGVERRETYVKEIWG